jgi:hypothetical protein
VTRDGKRLIIEAQGKLPPVDVVEGIRRSRAEIVALLNSPQWNWLK